MDIQDKLAHLIHHWVEHNESHVAGYREWAKLAREQGLTVAADGIDEAIVEVEKANKALERARAALES
jgi:hypothetical protein